EVATAWGAAADEDGVVAFTEQGFQRVDAPAGLEVDAKVDDVARFLVDDFFRQSEARDLGADHAAGLAAFVDDSDLVADRGEVAGHRERGRAATDAGDARRIGPCGWTGQAIADVVLQIGGNAFQPADRHRFGLLRLLLLDTSAPAGRFAGPVAGAPENAGKDVGAPVDHVGVAMTPGGNQPDVLGNGGMGRAGPLT